jgi:hypothetical protein
VGKLNRLKWWDPEKCDNNIEEREKTFVNYGWDASPIFHIVAMLLIIIEGNLGPT